MIEYFSELLFPPICIWCEEEWKLLCNECNKHLQSYPELCPHCHRVSKYYETCLDCKKQIPLEKIVIWFSYSTLIKRLIRDYKYWNAYKIWTFLWRKLTYIVQSSLIPTEWLLISYAPIHRYKEWFIRWYNQAEIIADCIWKELWVPVIWLFKKTKRTLSQTNYKRLKRQTNISWSIQLRHDHEKIIWLYNPKTILLVDDIMTTWTTQYTLAESIKEHYSKISIHWIVVARHK